MVGRLRSVALSLSFVALTGCMVSTQKNGSGDKDVALTTPLGGMSVKTDSSAVQAKIGLPLYPGAVLEHKKSDDNGAADVNMSFGAFHLRVLAMSFTSTDSPEKIDAFYRKALSQYSDVIECRGKQPVGTPTQTGLGLTCSDDKKVNVGDDTHDKSDETELRAGSRSREHIVSYSRQGTGTKFGLVWIELPRGDNSKGDSGD
jgi:hypothetical protein